MIRRDESGYSIVEVMVAILILMAAILPMFKMFDVSLQTATRSGDYDRARALAEKQAEISQSVSFSVLKGTGSGDYPYNASSDCGRLPDAGSTVGYSGCRDLSSAYANLRFAVDKTPSRLPASTSASEINIEDDPSANPQMVKVVIRVYAQGESPTNPIFRTAGVIANND